MSSQPRSLHAAGLRPQRTGLSVNQAMHFLLVLVAAQSAVGQEPVGDASPRRVGTSPPPLIHQLKRTGPSTNGREVFSIAFSPDGRRLAAGYRRAVALFDVVTGRQVLTLQGKTEDTSNGVYGLAFSPDGRRIATAGGHLLKLWDAGNGQEVLTVPGPHDFFFRLAFSPDGKHLATASRGGVACEAQVWDAASGQPIHALRGHTESPLCVAFSPDGKHLATSSGTPGGSKPGDVCIWDLATGKITVRLPRGSASVYSVAFSPNGRLLACSGSDGKVTVWDVGRQYALYTLAGHRGIVYRVAFDRWGLRLASAGADKRVKVWDLATGREVVALGDSNSYVYDVAFSPLGPYLAAASADGIVRVWSVGPPPGQDALLSPPELEALWDDLGAEDTGMASRAIWQGMGSPAQTIPLFQERLRPVAEPDAELQRRIARLIAELDHDRFVVRERATAELIELWHVAEPLLRRALAGWPPLEVRWRLEQILSRADRMLPPPAMLRLGRAIQILEAIGSPEAYEMLVVLAQGDPRVRWTMEARDALERMTQRAKFSHH